MNQEPTEILELNEPAPPVRGRPLARILIDRLTSGLAAAAPVKLVLPAIIAIGLVTGIAAGMLLV